MDLDDVTVACLGQALRLGQIARLVLWPYRVVVEHLALQYLYRYLAVRRVLTLKDLAEVAIAEPSAQLQVGDEARHQSFRAATMSIVVSRLSLRSVPPVVLSAQNASSPT
jgi:hypothetical protein